MATGNLFRDYVESKGVPVQTAIRDRTTTKGMTPQALRVLEGAAQGAAQSGLARLEIVAGKGGGHRSHGSGTEWDLIGYNADGSKWTNAQRVAVAQGGRASGADRFGLYNMSGGLGQGTLHIGYSGPGRQAAVWGAQGRTGGAASRRFTEPSERAFLADVSSGRPPRTPPASIPNVAVASNVPMPNLRPAVMTAANNKAPAAIAAAYASPQGKTSTAPFEAVLSRDTLSVADRNASPPVTNYKMASLGDVPGLITGQYGDVRYPIPGPAAKPSVSPSTWSQFTSDLQQGRLSFDQLPASWQQELTTKFGGTNAARVAYSNAMQSDGKASVPMPNLRPRPSAQPGPLLDKQRARPANVPPVPPLGIPAPRYAVPGAFPGAVGGDQIIRAALSGDPGAFGKATNAALGFQGNNPKSLTDYFTQFAKAQPAMAGQVAANVRGTTPCI